MVQTPLTSSKLKVITELNHETKNNLFTMVGMNLVNKLIFEDPKAPSQSVELLTYACGKRLDRDVDHCKLSLGLLRGIDSWETVQTHILTAFLEKLMKSKVSVAQSVMKAIYGQLGAWLSPAFANNFFYSGCVNLACFHGGVGTAPKDIFH